MVTLVMHERAYQANSYKVSRKKEVALSSDLFCNTGIIVKLTNYSYSVFFLIG